MHASHKKRVAVLRGGPSSEYEVSLKTGEAVLKALPSHKYEAIDVFIDKEGVWHVSGLVKTPADALKHVDVAFVALHGQYGEDGKVQRILESIGVPFTGSKALPSAVAMNKHLTKEALKALKGKVKMASHRYVTKEDIAAKGLANIFREIPHPSIIKPAGAGSSVGISIVSDFFSLEKALAKAFEHSEAVLIEEFIEGREATCGIVDGFRGEDTYSLMPVEIIPKKGSDFFDFEAKYGGASEEICPGNFDHATKEAVQEAAKAVHKALGLRHYSRSDFMVHPKRGVYFLEVNTLPGLTNESLLPKSLRAVGSSLSEFLDHTIGRAMEKK